MPRARTTDDSEETTSVKKSRTRKVSAVSVDGGELKPKPRTRRPKAIPEPEGVKIETVSETVRKAPTPIAEVRSRKARTLKTFFIMVVFCSVLIVSGVGIGVMDTGPIDVVAVVNDRNEKINRGEVRDEKTGQPITQIVQVQNTDARPNGGLQIADPVVVPPPVVIPDSSTTATSTGATSTEPTTATSTDTATVEAIASTTESN